MRAFETEILIAGGGLGGVAAALAALKLGRKVILTEETDWIGGQLTAQAVPPDENPWIESIGGSNTYQRLREGIRAYYRQHYPLLPEAREIVHLNPGNGNVSALCHEPRVALAVLESLLQPFPAGRQLTLLLRHRPVSAETAAPAGTGAGSDRVQTVTFMDEETGAQVVIRAAMVLDATELGDLLELAGVEHVVGSESQAQTGEPHALPGDARPARPAGGHLVLRHGLHRGGRFHDPPAGALRFLAQDAARFLARPAAWLGRLRPRNSGSALPLDLCLAQDAVRARPLAPSGCTGASSRRTTIPPGCTPATLPWSTGRRTITGWARWWGSRSLRLKSTCKAPEN